MSLIPEIKQAETGPSERRGDWIMTKNKINGEKIMYQDFYNENGFDRKDIVQKVEAMKAEFVKQKIDARMAVPLYFGKVGKWLGGATFNVKDPVIIYGGDSDEELGPITKYRVYMFKDNRAFRGKKKY